MDAATIASSFRRPDARQISTFFLGAVFIECLRCILFSPFFQKFIRNPRGLRRFSELMESEKSTLHTTRSGHHVAYLTLDVLLPVAFGVAALAHFASLLAFELSGTAGCAFVVAFGGVCQQLGRLVASMIILVDLRPMLHRFEFFGGIFWLVLGAASAFVDNALSTGILQRFDALQSSFCLRRRMIPSAAVAFALYVVLLLYFIARTCMVYSGPPRRHSTWELVTDAGLTRPMALIVLEVCTLLPTVTSLDPTGEFIPFSLALLLVLAAFSAETRLSYSELQPEQTLDIAPQPWSQNPSPMFRRTSPSWNPTSVASAPIQDLDRNRLSVFAPSEHQPRYSHPYPASPYAASSLDAPSLMLANFPGASRRGSAATAATSSEEGVVQLVHRSPSIRPEQAKMLDVTRSSKGPQLHPGATPVPSWTHRRIATPDQIDSFAKSPVLLPMPTASPNNGIPPPPMSGRPRVAVRTSIHAEPRLSSTSTQVYGSDIIRMTSPDSQDPDRDRTKRPTSHAHSATTTTYSMMSSPSVNRTDENYSLYASTRDFVPNWTSDIGIWWGESGRGDEGTTYVRWQEERLQQE